MISSPGRTDNSRSFHGGKHQLRHLYQLDHSNPELSHGTSSIDIQILSWKLVRSIELCQHELRLGREEFPVE